MSVHALVWRQIRLSTLVMALFIEFVMEMGATSFNASGGAAGLRGFTALLKNPAIEALYGRATQLNTAGALIAWKMGLFLALGVAIWSALLATRVTRGGEDVGSYDLIAVSRVGRRRAFLTTALVLVEAGLVPGVVVAVGLRAVSQVPVDCMLYGVAMTGIAWCGASLGLVAAQVLAPRRSASQAALGLLAVSFLVRMFGVVASGSGWLLWATPFGWLESVGAFQQRTPVWLVPLLTAPVLLAVLAWRLEAARDVGVAVWTRSDRTRARERLLHTPWRFAWRERRSTLVAWSVGLALLGLTLGYLTNALVEFCRADPAYVRLLERWGFGAMVTAKGFVGETGSIIGVLLGYFVLTLLAMVASDGRAGRLDLPLSFGASRLRWLLAALASTAAATLVVATVCGFFVWVGVEASGTPMSAWDPIDAMLNAASPVLLVGGLVVLLVAVVPRFAYLVMAALLGFSFVIASVGPSLHWPSWIVDTSPFHYLHLVPAIAPNWGATGWFLLLGVVTGGAGLGAFSRLDIGT
jgi:ABC-2 type transport system permease protein